MAVSVLTIFLIRQNSKRQIQLYGNQTVEARTTVPYFPYLH